MAGDSLGIEGDGAPASSPEIASAEKSYNCECKNENCCFDPFPQPLRWFFLRISCNCFSGSALVFYVSPSGGAGGKSKPKTATVILS